MPHKLVCASSGEILLPEPVPFGRSIDCTSPTTVSRRSRRSHYLHKAVLRVMEKVRGRTHVEPPYARRPERDSPRRAERRFG